MYIPNAVKQRLDVVADKPVMLYGSDERAPQVLAKITVSCLPFFLNSGLQLEIHEYIPSLSVNDVIFGEIAFEKMKFSPLDPGLLLEVPSTFIPFSVSTGVVEISSFREAGTFYVFRRSGCSKSFLKSSPTRKKILILA